MNEEKEESWEERWRKNDARELGLPETATRQEILIEKNRKELIEYVNRQYEEPLLKPDASWEEIYNGILSLTTLNNDFGRMQKGVVVAAEWWYKKLNEGHNDKENYYNNGDPNLINKINEFHIEPKGIPEDKKYIFIACLVKEFTKEIKIHNRADIYCDYRPDSIFRQINTILNINELDYPFKTGIVIEKDGTIRYKGEVIYTPEEDIKVFK